MAVQLRSNTPAQKKGRWFAAAFLVGPADRSWRLFELRRQLQVPLGRLVVGAAQFARTDVRRPGGDEAVVGDVGATERPDRSGSSAVM